MTRKKRKARGSKKGASSSRSTKPQQAQSSRSRQARQKGQRNWLPIAALTLAAILIGIGGIWALNRPKDTDLTVAEASNAELDKVLRITPQELKAKLDADQAVVFDSRSEESYAKKRIPAAISMPKDEVATRLTDLPADGKLAVFYCTWPAEEESAGAALVAIQNGITNVAALVGGLSAWEQAGYPVDSGESPVASVLTPSVLGLEDQGPRPSAIATPAEGTILSSADMPRITVQELKAKLDAGQAVIVDVRPQADYARQHIAGAVSLPQSEVTTRLAELPTDGKLVAFYCTWPAEQDSAGAALMASTNGVTNVAALLGGMSAWEEAGYGIESGGN